MGPSVSLDYMTEVNRYYAELYRRHLAVDVVRKTDDLSDYAAVFAPCLYMVDAATEANLRSYVQGGGRLVMTTMSSITDEHDMCHLGGAPSPLRDVFGVWAEETDATAPQFSTPLIFERADSSLGSGSLLCDVLRVDTARTIASYGGDDYYAGTPAVTENVFGDGLGYYVATMPDEAALTAIADRVFDGLSDVEEGAARGVEASEGIEVTQRVGDDGSVFSFVIDLVGKGGTASLESEGIDLLSGETLSGEVDVPRFGVVLVKY